jgi:plasmid maintenance system killer protein
MQRITDVVRELQSITGALFPPHTNPFEKPPRRIYELPAHPEELVFSFDSVEYPGYPAWVEEELWDPTDRAIEGGLSREPSRIGIDALAWYISFHHDGPGWGIYIPISSLAYFECRVFSNLPISREKKWDLAFEVLLAHERMHFIVDYHCAQWELLLHSPCRAALKERMKGDGIPYLLTEEQVANAFMLHQLRSGWSSPAKKAIDGFVRRQPPGYRDGHAVIQDAAFLSAFAEVVKSYVALHSLERGLHITVNSYEIVRDFPLKDTSDSYVCPVYVFDDDRLGIPESAISFLTCLPGIVETDSFCRKFDRLESSLQNRWTKLKNQLPDGIPRSARFEKLKGTAQNVFSVRLNDNFRVHLRQMEGGWEAFAVGSHKEMGHG